MTWFIAKAGAKAAAAACAGALLAAGCAPAPLVQCDLATFGTPAPVTGARLEPMTPGTMRPVPLDTVSITDAALRGRVAVQAVSAGRTPTGDIDVGARVFNCGDGPLLIEGRTSFLDAAQRPAEPATAWQRFVVEGRSFGDYREVSVSGPRAVSYLVELRSGQ